MSKHHNNSQGQHFGDITNFGEFLDLKYVEINFGEKVFTLYKAMEKILLYTMWAF